MTESNENTEKNITVRGFVFKDMDGVLAIANKLTGGERKLTHDEFCKIVYKSTFAYREGENRCRVGIVDGSDIKIYVLTGEQMDTVYNSVVNIELEEKDKTFA